MTTPKNPDESSETPPTGSAPQSGQESAASSSPSKKAEEPEPTGTEWATPTSAGQFPGETTQPSMSSSGGGESSSSGSAQEPPVTGAAPQSTGPEGWNQPGAGQPEYPSGGQPEYPSGGQPGYPGYPSLEKPGEQHPYPGSGQYPGGQSGYPPGGGQSYPGGDQQGYPPGSQPDYSSGQSPYGSGFPSYPQQSQPYDDTGRPRKPGTQTMSILGFVCAALALVLCPILFGPAGIVFGILGHNKGEPLGRWAAIASGVALVAGLVLSFLVLNAEMVPDQN
ncbi:DUF4190 domain-containing protein [Nocardia xishanensis]|uniref:DUF4190 domain-containing protein n=1 Tax=Nocardia xishanensis TaxID=238964 RepID=UPI00082A7079|nr:DUF4190 domain-containing protein [Nocardia xishanensis]